LRDFLFGIQLGHSGIVGDVGRQRRCEVPMQMHMQVREAAAAVFQLLRALERRGARAELAKGSKQSSVICRP
jgi:hypothetical protein